LAPPGIGCSPRRTPASASSIAVVPSRRGRGFGHELLSGLLERAREDGFDAISLSVDRDNPAVALYESYGFEHVREDDGAVVMRAPLSSG
jgi:[ribosomal protein S18]-alanine N-acetyltransferase